ncbi:MAG: SUMF1/EgtB/PvdO family nonheme iron enzyme, partial [Anaerolineae bacterium]
YAARGPDRLKYPWGNDFVPEAVVYYENSNKQTAEIGRYPSGASWVGALDMSGNVWEWVSSIYQPYPYQADDGREDLNNTDDPRARRGGSFSNTLIYLRTTLRSRLNPSEQIKTIGFRCARDY